MILSPKMIFGLLFILFIAGCGLNNESLGPTEEQKEEIAQRIAPIGTIVMFGDASSVVEESIPMDIQKVSLSPGPEHTVKMLNMGVDGSMVFEPAVLKVSKGDTIHFKAVDLSHNSASIEGMIPARKPLGGSDESGYKYYTGYRWNLCLSMRSSRNDGHGWCNSSRRAN